MAFTELLLHWHFDPLLLLFTATLTGLYGFVSRFRRSPNNWYFGSCIFIFLIATCSPLHYLGMHYYFSAYMVCHVTVLLVCGPLLVMAVPNRPSLFVAGRFKRLSAYLASRPWLTWFAAVGTMWFWHIPLIFDHSMTAMQNGFSIVTCLHPVSMLAGGFLFSWPLFGPPGTRRLHPLSGVLYLFTACVSCSLLGLLITFAPAGTYHHYIQMAGMPGRPWNISPQDDQQAAGLIMWVPCCFLYLGGCIYLLLHWFSAKPVSTGKRDGTIQTLMLDENRKK
ncbi:MAG: cytochrome c oxidase assembly protein [Bacteroidetes bacterium]|nr:cytochrome c oxidase assembly protein [Bacteroidota bacterium]